MSSTVSRKALLGLLIWIYYGKVSKGAIPVFIIKKIIRVICSSLLLFKYEELKTPQLHYFQ